MKLNKRLKTICDMIPVESEIIDVGTDHGYVPIYLNKFKNCHCLATDISEFSLSKARNNALKTQANIDFLCTDGLNNINLKKQIIIISGMGTKTILDILNKNITNDLVISTNNDVNYLIEELIRKGYIVKENKKIIEHKTYEIIYFKYIGSL